MTKTTTLTLAPYDVLGGDVLADSGDYVLQVDVGRAYVAQVQRADGTVGRRSLTASVEVDAAAHVVALAEQARLWQAIA